MKPGTMAATESQFRSFLIVLATTENDLRWFHRIDSRPEARISDGSRGRGRSAFSKSAISSMGRSTGEKASSIVGSCA